MDRTNTILIDADRLFLDGIERLFDDSQFEVTNKYPSVEEAMGAIHDGRKASLILIGTPPRNRSELATIAKLREAAPKSRIVVLVSDTLRGLVSDCLDNSCVDSLLHRDMAADALIRSLSLIMDGAWIIPTRVAKLLMSAANSESGLSANRMNHGLSDREMEILHCLVNGDPNKVIARALSITEATVKVHLKNLLKKINVTNRTQAAVWAIKNGIGEDYVSELADAGPSAYSVAA